MKPIGEMSIGELAAFVCSHLDRHGIEVVLAGGACVSIYSNNRYASYDLDFIERFHINRKKLRQALAEIGFHEEHRYFKHLETEFFLEFPAVPLAIGGEPVNQIQELHSAFGTLRMLSPTDCVKDRLAAFYHWRDRQCLHQALWVAERNAVDWDEIERWSVRKGAIQKFREFKELLNKDKI